MELVPNARSPLLDNPAKRRNYKSHFLLPSMYHSTFYEYLFKQSVGAGSCMTGILSTCLLLIIVCDA